MSRRRLTLAVSAISLACLLLTGCVSAPSGESGSKIPSDTLVVGLGATDLPNLDTALSLNLGSGGLAFVGLSIYDTLTKWDLTQSETAPQVLPNLATEWEANEDATEWTLTLRPGVKFTDGSPWNAEVAAFNINRYANPESKQFYPQLNGMTGMFNGGIASAEAVDEFTLLISMSRPTSALPYNLAGLPMGSKTAIEELGNEEFAKSPVGSGPFIYESSERGQSVTLVRNEDYWGDAPSFETLIIKPIPDATARTAALKAGDINWLEGPNPTDLTSFKDDEYTVHMNSYDHHWIWQMEVAEGPLADVKVRQAMNFAIDRETIADDLLQGTASPMFQAVSPGNAAYRSEADYYSYDPSRAKELLAEAGYAEGFEMTLSYPTAGAGALMPKDMNVAIQRDLAAVGIDVKLEPSSWETMVASMNEDRIPGDADAINFAGSLDPEPFWVRYYGTEGPRNMGDYSNSTVDDLFAEAAATVDPAARADIYASAAEILTEESPWLFVVSSLNPRVTASNVVGFVQPKSWYVDLTNITVKQPGAKQLSDRKGSDR